MHRCWLIIACNIIFAAAPINGFAESNDMFADSCDNFAPSQWGLNVCAQEAFEKSDKQLNIVYSQLMECVSKSQSQYIHASKNDIRAAQKAWVTFRDAAGHADAKFNFEDDIKTSPMPEYYYRTAAHLTEQRTADLEAMLAICNKNK